MKIDVRENSNQKETKVCDFPLDSEYSGEHENEDDLKIFIYRETLTKIDAYLSGDLNNELGGVLLGEDCINSDNRKFILIDNLIIAKHTNSSLSRLTFTHETWDYINEVREKDFPDKKILGWFHSHPGHTVFLSSFDIFIQENFFNMDYMVAYVFDPTIKERGFFQWRNSKIVRSDGYYVADNIPDDEYNVRIPINNDMDLLKVIDKDKSSGKKTAGSFGNIKTIITLVLTLCVLLLMIYNIYDINQNSIQEEEYQKDLANIKMENKKLTERLNNLMMEIEYKRNQADTNSEVINNEINSTTGTGSGEENLKKNEVAKVDNDKVTTGRRYKVKTGDNLEKIALQFYNNESAMDLIMKQNNIKNKNDIRLGQELDLPPINE